MRIKTDIVNENFTMTNREVMVQGEIKFIGPHSVALLLVADDSVYKFEFQLDGNRLLLIESVDQHDSGKPETHSRTIHDFRESH